MKMAGATAKNAREGPEKGQSRDLRNEEKSIEFQIDSYVLIPIFDIVSPGYTLGSAISTIK